MSYSLGIDLGGSSIKVVAVTPAGKSLLKRNVEFAADAKMDWAAKIRAIVEQIRDERGEPALHIGLSAPGLAAPDGRSIAHMPGRLQGLEQLDWTKFLGTSAPVLVLNDAHAALLGEAWLGAARRIFSQPLWLTASSTHLRGHRASPACCGLMRYSRWQRCKPRHAGG